MTPKNLAIVFAPVLLRSKDTDDLQTMLKHSEACVGVVMTCIENYDTLFGPDSHLIDKRALDERIATMGFNRKVKKGSLAIIQRMIDEEADMIPSSLRTDTGSTLTVSTREIQPKIEDEQSEDEEQSEKALESPSNPTTRGLSETLPSSDSSDLVGEKLDVRAGEIDKMLVELDRFKDMPAEDLALSLQGEGAKQLSDLLFTPSRDSEFLAGMVAASF